MIGIYHYRDDIDKNGVVYSYEELHEATFEPMPCDILILDGAKGKTYRERKEYIIDQAILFHYLHHVVTMYWGDLATIGAYFEHYGRRYGLLTEFRENGIL